MGKNGLLERQRAANMAFFNAGLQMGRQQILDMMCLSLHDPEIMIRDTFGGKRLLKLIKDIGSKIDEYYLAWQKKRRERLLAGKARRCIDGCIRRTVGAQLCAAV